MSSVSGGGGGFGGGTSNQSRIWLQLKPRRERQLTAAQVIEELRPKVMRFPGIRVFTTLPPSIREGGRQSKAPYEFTVNGPSPRQLYPDAAKLERELASLPVLQHA